jgi:uncharacterized protein (DUF4415 family)
MTRQWPRFVTKDLGDSDEDDAEMMRRWEAYEREMRALIAAGGVHQDEDGWWVDDATGDLIGPDPELERPRSKKEVSKARPLKEALPELHESIQRARGRPRLEKPKEAVTLRLDPDILDWFRNQGPGYQPRINAVLRHYMDEVKKKAGE